MRYIDLAPRAKNTLRFRNLGDLQSWLAAFKYIPLNVGTDVFLSQDSLPGAVLSFEACYARPSTDVSMTRQTGDLRVAVHRGFDSIDNLHILEVFNGAELTSKPEPVTKREPHETTRRITPEGVTIETTPIGDYYGKRKAWITQRLTYKVHGPEAAVEHWILEQLSVFTPDTYATEFTKVSEENGVLTITGSRNANAS